MNRERRVVITGIGLLSPVGLTVEENWNNLISGTSGVRKLDYLSRFGEDLDKKISVKIAGEVKGFDIQNYFPEKAKAFSKDMDQVTLFSMAASKMALEDASLIEPIKNQEIDLERFCTIIGTGIGGIGTTANDVLKLRDLGPRRVGVRSIIRLMPNALSGQAAIEWGLRGTAKDVTTACASGLDSLIDAYHHIKFGLYDYALSGGSEAPLVPFSIISFSSMKALSSREVSPEKASTPFSKERDGFVISEGAAVFVLEELEHAKARKAKIYAEIGGGASTCDAFHITAPHETGEGASQAMKQAIQKSGLSPSDLDYIHAHGTSTPLNDQRETLAIRNTFGKKADDLLISSTKSMTGHMIAAAGAFGVFVLCYAINKGVIPPTINLEQPDLPDCDLNYVPNQSIQKKVRVGISNAFGFGGHNACMLLREFN